VTGVQTCALPILGFLALDDAMGIAKCGDGVLRKQLPHHLDFLEADNIRAQLRDEALEAIEAKADRINIPCDDAQHSARLIAVVRAQRKMVMSKNFTPGPAPKRTRVGALADPFMIRDTIGT